MEKKYVVVDFENKYDGVDFFSDKKSVIEHLEDCGEKFCKNVSVYNIETEKRINIRISSRLTIDLQ